jgi:hypothetical protein
MSTQLLILLERVIPFRFLSREHKEALVPELTRYEFDAGDIVIEQDDDRDKSVYLIESGSVEVRDRHRNQARLVDTIVSGHYCGEWEPLFDVPRAFEISALEQTVCYALSGQRLIELIGESHAFAQALATILRDKQRIFAAFERFHVELIRGINDGHVNITQLLPLYRALRPALHPHCEDAAHIDVDALSYGVRRLPENITRTFAFLLTDEVPPAYSGPDRFFHKVPTDARRRDIWEMLPGKNLVLLRNGDSDLVDLVSCLCLYSVEAQKIRRRLAVPEILSRLSAWCAGPEEKGASAAKADGASKPDPDGEFLKTLPFTEEEVRGLQEVWPENTVRRLYDMVIHREMFSVDVRRQTTNYNSRRTDQWTAQVADATNSLLGCQPSALPDEVRVHIVSSNTHSVTNCLNPWYRHHSDTVLQWARESEHPYLREEWPRDSDLVYAVARDFFREHPDAAAESAREEAASGTLRLKETASTGIEVQLIDTRQLESHAVDQGISRVSDMGTHDVIVNIDYAFGEQAEHIIRNLLLLFGENLASVNFFGKAGALVGSRGHILIPTAFIKQSTDQFLPLPEDQGGTNQRLIEAVGHERVHSGPLLTVEGSLLQNKLMLHFYRHLWSCLGLEMEGAHYYRQVLESQQLGVIPSDVALRCFYYVSDLPLAHGKGLAVPLSASEGVPPLYAITRHILSEILG